MQQDAPDGLTEFGKKYRAAIADQMRAAAEESGRACDAHMAAPAESEEHLRSLAWDAEMFRG